MEVRAIAMSPPSPRSQPNNNSKVDHQEHSDIDDQLIGTSGSFNGNGNGKSNKPESGSSSQQSKPQEKRQFTVYKYSNKGKSPLHEAVILSGRPVFLKCGDNSKSSSSIIEAVDRIEEDIRTINPPHAEHYPYEPVEFDNMNEVFSYADRARNENIDSLYLQAKQIASDYNDQKKDKVNLLAIEIIASYFQDRFPTTHYDIVLGEMEAGRVLMEIRSRQ
jgi:hypothetical protein